MSKYQCYIDLFDSLFLFVFEDVSLILNIELFVFNLQAVKILKNMTELSLNTINWFAVVVVLIFSFALGAFWHSKILFGKAWSEDSKTPYNSENHGNPAIIFGLSAVLHFIMLVGLAALTRIAPSALEGFMYGLLVSVVFVSTAIGVTYVFAGRTLRLFLIDAGFYVVLLSVAGLVFSVWR